MLSLSIYTCKVLDPVVLCKGGEPLEWWWQNV